MTDPESPMTAPGGPSSAISNEVTKCNYLKIFGTLCADSKRISNSTPDMFLITVHTIIMIYVHANFMHMQAFLHTRNIRSKLDKMHFVAHRVSLLAARPIEAYMVPSCE